MFAIYKTGLFAVYVGIEHDKTTGTKYAYVLSTIHCTPEYKLTMCFSDKFSDHQIINSGEVLKQLERYE